MSVTYRPAPSVARIARTLIGKHHTQLAGVRIDYVFRSEAAKHNGKTVMGKARKISGLNAYLAQAAHDEVPVDDEEDMAFFVVEIAEDVWAALDQAQRIALVDHELCHLTTDVDKDENLVLKLAPHDLEEFRAVVERHGLWQPDLTRFADAMKYRQLQLGEDESAA